MISEIVSTELEPLLSFQNMSKKEKEVLIFLMKSNRSHSISDLERHLKITRYYLYELSERLVEKGLVNKIPSQPVRYAFDFQSINFLIDQYKKEIMVNEVSKKNISITNRLLRDMKNYNLFRPLFSRYKQNQFSLIDVLSEEIIFQYDFNEKKTRTTLNSFVRQNILLKDKIGRKNIFNFKSLDEIIKIKEFQINKQLKFKIERLSLLQSKLFEIKDKSLHEDLNLTQNLEQKEERVIILSGKQTIRKVQYEFSLSKQLLLARLVHEQSLLTKDKLVKITRNILPLIISASQRGARIKLILPAEIAHHILKDPYQSKDKGIEKILHSPNIKIKISEVKNLPFDIIDNLLYFEYLGITTSSCLFVKDKEAVNAKISLFNEIWQQAESFNEF